MHVLLVLIVSLLAVSQAWQFLARKSLRWRGLTTLNAVATYKVTIQHEGIEKVLNVRSDCSVLDAALDAGIELPHDCKLGVCLTCPSRIVSGIVDQTGGTLDDSVMDQGYALTCITYPRSDCVVKSIDEDELVSAQFKRD